MKKKKLASVFGIGGIFYVFLEVLYTSITAGEFRLVGQSSLWMMALGGFLCVILDLMNERAWLRKIDYRLRVLLGGVVISALELAVGCILNLWLSFDIWDYSDAFGNILGQTDLLHFLYWVGITPFGFWLGDVIRYYVYDEARPEDSLARYYTKIFKK